MQIIVLGPAGAGKGTLASRLASRFHLARFDTGAALRAYAAAHDPALAAHLGRGGMAPMGLASQLLADAIQRPAAGTTGVAIDGFPRSVEQADDIIRRNAEGTLPLTAVFLLEADRAVLADRLLARRHCPGCSAAYNLRSAPPPAPNRCACGAALAVRADDTDDGIALRFRLYEEQTVPALARLHAARLPVVTLDASQPAEMVFQAALNAIGPRTASVAATAVRPPSAAR